jgi:hypothetical protein
MGLFNKSKAGAGSGAHAAGSARPSRGWTQTLEFLKSRENLRVLDFGATSPANINLLTQLGHSVYMSNAVDDAAQAEWMKAGEKGEKEFDAEGFAAANFDFSGKEFDAVLLWDTADFLPAAAVQLLFARLRSVLHADGRLLAFFHGKTDVPVVFSRYHVTDGPQLVLQPIGGFNVRRSYQTREIEKFLTDYADVRFLLGKDNVREVIAVR